MKSYIMENNIPTLYILQRDSYVVKNAKIFNYFWPFCDFCPKNIKHSSYCYGNMTRQSEPAFSVDIIPDTSCCNVTIFLNTAKGCWRHVFLVNKHTHEIINILMSTRAQLRFLSHSDLVPVSCKRRRILSYMIFCS